MCGSLTTLGDPGGMAAAWGGLEVEFARGGHALVRHKCKFLAPGEQQGPETAARLAVVGRCGAAEGQLETSLSPFSIVVAAARKRLDAALELCARLGDMARARMHDMSHLVAWTLLQKNWRVCAPRGAFRSLANPCRRWLSGA